MRFLRYGPEGEERPALLDASGLVRDLGNLVDDIGPEILSDSVLSDLRALDVQRLPVVRGTPRYGACVAGVGKIIGVSKNYRAHAPEKAIDASPALFMKAPSSICGPYDVIARPYWATKLDWEVELAVVIGTRMRHIGIDDVMKHVAGFCVANDVTERDAQYVRGTPSHTMGKSADTFCPLGPWFVTRDEVVDYQNLRLETIVQGVTMQQDTTASMLISVPELLSYISRFMTLMPGDVVLTGTPAGSAFYRPDKPFLVPGDEVILRIEGLGEQRHIIVPEDEPEGF